MRGFSQEMAHSPSTAVWPCLHDSLLESAVMNHSAAAVVDTAYVSRCYQKAVAMHAVTHLTCPHLPLCLAGQHRQQDSGSPTGSSSRGITLCSHPAAAHSPHSSPAWGPRTWLNLSKCSSAANHGGIGSADKAAWQHSSPPGCPSLAEPVERKTL